MGKPANTFWNALGFPLRWLRFQDNPLSNPIIAWWGDRGFPLRTRSLFFRPPSLSVPVSDEEYLIALIYINAMGKRQSLLALSGLYDRDANVMKRVGFFLGLLIIVILTGAVISSFRNYLPELVINFAAVFPFAIIYTVNIGYLDLWLKMRWDYQMPGFEHRILWILFFIILLTSSITMGEMLGFFLLYDFIKRFVLGPDLAMVIILFATFLVPYLILSAEVQSFLTLIHEKRMNA